MDPYSSPYMGGCQNYGPFWGTLNIRCRTILGTQKGTIILTIPHITPTLHSTFFSIPPFPASPKSSSFCMKVDLTNLFPYPPEEAFMLIEFGAWGFWA